MRLLGLMTLLALASCATSDLGSPCQMPSSVDSADPGFDYLYLGATECDDQVCLQRSQSSESFCSRACLDDSDCGAGFGCVQLVPGSLDVEGVDAKRYCASP